MKKSVLIAGLPESGKTTFLAALWHLIADQSERLKLSFVSIGNGNVGYLNGIASTWRAAKVQPHTHHKPDDPEKVTLNLQTYLRQSVSLTFPDLSGESFQNIWEKRLCSALLQNKLADDFDGILLFVNVNKIVRPHSIKEYDDLRHIMKKFTIEAEAKSVLEAEAAESAAEARPGMPSVVVVEPVPKAKDEEHADDDGEASEANINDAVLPWKPEYAPTQVKVVDLLQNFCSDEISAKTRKLAVMLSAWDTVDEQSWTPLRYIEEELPLLSQYLRSGADNWDWRVYGLSAQGGVYLNESIEQSKEEIQEAKQIRDIRATERIKLWFNKRLSRDLTEPIAWLTQ